MIAVSHEGIRCNTTGITILQIFCGSLNGTLGLLHAVLLFTIQLRTAQSHYNWLLLIKSTWDSVYTCQSKVETELVGL